MNDLDQATVVAPTEDEQKAAQEYFELVSPHQDPAWITYMADRRRPESEMDRALQVMARVALGREVVVDATE